MSCDYTETNDTRFEFVNKENLENDSGRLFSSRRTPWKNEI